VKIKVVAEEVAPMGIEDITPSVTFQDTMIAQEELAHFEVVSHVASQ
jgi:hypothetical protein